MRPLDRVAADSLQNLLVLPPGAAPDVCPGCHGWRSPGEPWCPNCRAMRFKVRSVCEAVIPISLYSRPSAFRDMINRYKERPTAVDDTMDILPPHTSREHCAQRIGLILNRFLIELFPQLSARGKRWDCLTVVPSRWRLDPHPLVAMLEAMDVGAIQQWLRRAPDGLFAHDHPNERAFDVSGSVKGKSVLLVDDVFTTGASLHSAAAALSNAGATVIAGIVIARRMQPGYNEHSQSVWDRQSGQRFQWHIAAETGILAMHRDDGL